MEMTRLIEHIDKLKEIIQKNEPGKWTEEQFSLNNSIFTSIEEYIMIGERKYSEFMLEIKDLKECMVEIRRIYFEAHEIEMRRRNEEEVIAKISGKESKILRR
jgi:hypothetical protein